MERNSPFKIFLLDYCTFGIYGLIWLFKSSKEVEVHGWRLPSRIWLVVSYVGSVLLGLLFLIWVAFFMHDLANQTSISQECWAQSVVSQAATHDPTIAQRVDTSFSDECKRQVADSSHSQDRIRRDIQIFGILFAASIVMLAMQVRYMAAYAAAVQQMTKNKLRTDIVMILVFNPLHIGLPILQNYFNTPSNLVTFNEYSQTESLHLKESKTYVTVKRALYVVLAVMVLLLLMGLVLITQGLGLLHSNQID